MCRNTHILILGTCSWREKAFLRSEASDKIALEQGLTRTGFDRQELRVF